MPYLDSSNYELPYQSSSDTSQDAALKAKQFVGQQGLEVLWWFGQRGEYGATQKEVAVALRIGRPSVCARVNALEKQGRLAKTDRRRDGCAVYKAV